MHYHLLSIFAALVIGTSVTLARVCPPDGAPPYTGKKPLPPCTTNSDINIRLGGLFPTPTLPPMTGGNESGPDGATGGLTKVTPVPQ